MTESTGADPQDQPDDEQDGQERDPEQVGRDEPRPDEPALEPPREEPGEEDAEHQPLGQGDPDLVSLVQLANAFGLEQSVVLTLPGQVVAGTLVGGKSFFEELARSVQGEDPDETMRGALAAKYRRRGKDFEEWGVGSSLGDLDPDGPEGKDLAPLPGTDYLHLRDASVVTWPASGQRLPLWRGRVADIVGWTVGELLDTPSHD